MKNTKKRINMKGIGEHPINAIWETITVGRVSPKGDYPIDNIVDMATELVEEELRKIKDDEFEKIIDTNYNEFMRALEEDPIQRSIGLLQIYRCIVEYVIEKEV